MRIFGQGGLGCGEFRTVRSLGNSITTKLHLERRTRFWASEFLMTVGNIGLYVPTLDCRLLGATLPQDVLFNESNDLRHDAQFKIISTSTALFHLAALGCDNCCQNRTG